MLRKKEEEEVRVGGRWCFYREQFLFGLECRVTGLGSHDPRKAMSVRNEGRVRYCAIG